MNRALINIAIQVALVTYSAYTARWETNVFPYYYVIYTYFLRFYFIPATFPAPSDTKSTRTGNSNASYTVVHAARVPSRTLFFFFNNNNFSTPAHSARPFLTRVSQTHRFLFSPFPPPRRRPASPFSRFPSRQSLDEWIILLANPLHSGLTFPRVTRRHPSAAIRTRIAETNKNHSGKKKKKTPMEEQTGNGEKGSAEDMRGPPVTVALRN